jgi:hypothetical protein
MAEPNHQTVRLQRGRHRSPADGVCVVELASMLAGERFCDHPRSVCPVIAAFLRPYNDRLPDGDRSELLPYAAAVVGSRVGPLGRVRRALALIEWATDEASLRLRATAWAGSWIDIGSLAADAALARSPRRHEEVTELLRSLLRIGARGGAAETAPIEKAEAEPADTERAGVA